MGENTPFAILVAQGQGVTRQTKVQVKKTSYMVFIQLDKPVYTPRQKGKSFCYPPKTDSNSLLN